MEKPILQQIKDFVRNVPEFGLFSTDQKVINYTGSLYNVSGSTEDPKEVYGYENKTWKYILNISAGLGDAGCYVTNVNPSGETSHPEFSVGGHMTENMNGKVIYGADSYLMPLCSWHNNPARNGIAFEHQETKMILLSGYMQGEPAITFMMRNRNSSQQPFSLLFLDENSGIWKLRNISSKEALKIGQGETKHHLLLERPNFNNNLNVIKEVNLPKL